MENKTNSRRTEGLLALFDMHSGFLARALDGISAEDMQNRLNTQANHMAWLAGSMVQQRYTMVAETNPGLKQTGHDLFSNNKGIQEDAQYPSIAEYIKDWEYITPLARKALAEVDDTKLDSELTMGTMKMSFYDMVVFTLYREASLVGQLALWRRLLGYPALKYD